MIRLRDYREFWEDVAARVDGISSVMPVTIDEEMGKRIQGLKTTDLPVLFWVPPMAEGGRGSDADSLAETNTCVVYVMTRYDPLKGGSSLQALEQTQEAVETLKAMLLSEFCCRCGAVNVNAESISTMPETRFYRNFAGWSVGFTTET